MKVLNIISSVDPRGGGPIAGVISSSEVWLQNGHDSHILSLDPSDAPWAVESSVTTFALGLNGKAYRLLRRIVPLLRYGYTPRLTGWLRSNAKNYDAVIINGLWNYTSFGSWRALRKLDTPYFVFTHGMLDPWFNWAYPTKTFFKSIFWRLFEHKVLRDARGVMFTCEEERVLARESFAPYVAKEYVVGLGANDVEGDPEAQRTAFVALVPQVESRKFILFLSRIHEKKGVDLLIEAFARHAASFPEIDLVIAGPDQTGWRGELEKLARERGIADRLHWPGMLVGDAKWGAFRSAEFFCLPSHQENFGIVVAEAMALGKSVLITNKVNIWREIQADGAGRVVNDDIDSISDGLQAMVSQAPGERDEMGRKARKCFANRYDLKRNAMQLLLLLQRLSTSP